MVFNSSCAHGARSGLSRALLLVCFLQISNAFAADDAPITKTYDDSYIMSRVQLVGVIAGGLSETSGIAVIKDIHSGRSYAVKTGDALPGVGHIVLTKVQREVAIFKSNDQEYLVRVSIGPSPNSTKPESSVLASEDGSEQGQPQEDKGPGLFEKWAAGAIERGADLISLDKIKNKKPSMTSPAPMTGAVDGAAIRSMAEQDQPEENVVIEDDSDDVDPSL